MLKRRLIIGERFGYRNAAGEIIAHVSVLGINRDGSVELGIESDRPISTSEFKGPKQREKDHAQVN